MMCSAEVTGSLVPIVAKQIQSVEPETNKTVMRQQLQNNRVESSTETEVMVTSTVQTVSQ